MKRTPEEALKTRQSLLDAAVAVFRRKGVARSSLEEIARTAGVTRGALYWHFKDKQDLFDALFQARFARMESELGDNNDLTFPKLIDVFMRLFERIDSSPNERDFLEILYIRCEENDVNQDISNLLRQHHHTYATSLHAAINNSVANGELPRDLDIKLATILLLSCLEGIMANYYKSSCSYLLADYGKTMLQACAYMIETAPHLRCSQ